MSNNDINTINIKHVSLHTYFSHIPFKILGTIQTINKIVHKDVRTFF